MIVLAAVLAYFAFHPREAFYLDESWKFNDPPEPSDAYVALNMAGRLLAAALLVGVAIWLIVTGVPEVAVFADQSDSSAASIARCRNEIEPQVKETVQWDGPIVANPDEVKKLAERLAVDVVIERASKLDFETSRADPLVTYDVVRVSDPRKPGSRKELFVLDGYLSEWGGNRGALSSYC